MDDFEDRHCEEYPKLQDACTVVDTFKRRTSCRMPRQSLA